MNKVEPIRDPRKIQELKDYLLQWNEKYYMMWLLGSNIGLRVSDIIKIRVKDILDKDHLVFKDQKTGKEHRLPVNRHLKKEIREYIEQHHLQDDDFLIQSQKGENQPLSRIQAYCVLNTAAKACGIESSIGTHTMRKTFGYWHYRQHKDVALLQQVFGHSAPSVTLRYIGINDDIVDKSLEDFYI